MPARAHLDHGVVNSFLRGPRYPLDRDRIVELAKANGVVDEYLEAFGSLPDREYRSQDDVMDALRDAGYSLS